MAEIKNNFIRSKMNKDLDRRLIPDGEYINAINSQISMSEGDGVGTLENILGNELVATLVTPAVANLISIGYYVDQINNFIYIFLTDNYTSSYVEQGGGIGSNHFICRYNALNNTTTTLVTGAFLNFSTLNPIYGINLLENLLFFTDNRNQPRKINVTNAANDASYYTTEDQISVAKYNPYDSIYLYEPSTESSTADAYQSTMKDVVSKFMPGGGSATTSGGSSQTAFALSNGLFPFYPNKPVPGQTVGKIQTPGDPIVMLPVTVAASPVPTSTSVSFTNNITLNNGDELIFFPNPYYNNTYSGDSAFLEDKFVRFSYRFKFEDNEYSLIAPFTQSCFIPKQDGYFLTTGLTAFDNDQTQAAESSIVSFMENKVNSIGLQIPLPTSQTSLFSDFKITEIEILYKESDGLVIKAVDTIDVSTLSSSNNFLEYLYVGNKPFKTLLEKETARVFDKVPVKSLAQEVSGNRVIYSNFQNRHTPPASLDYSVNATPKPEFDLRTGSATSGSGNSGKTINLVNPKGIYIVGSKVFFSGAPANLLIQNVVNSGQIQVNQNVTIGSGVAITFQPSSNDQNTTSRIEYPSSSLKTNRSYQVGVVLSDKYGRTSDVILSNNDSTVTLPSTESFSGSSLYSGYLTENGTQQAFNWPGNSLKVLFNSVIGPENSSGFYPGIYNGTVTDPNYNPLGWYSYKIVVQQKEQDYYNVYAPGAIKGDVNNDLTGGTTALNMNTSRIILINDNINKVPRDLSEVGPQDKTFRSSVQLIGRVVNNIGQYRPPYSTGPTVQPTAADSNLGNQQYYPNTRTFTTNTIQPLFDNQDWPNGYLVQGNVTEPQTIPPLDNTQPIFSFYSAETNPFVAEITTSPLNDDNYQFGTVNPFYNGIGVGNMRYVPINQLCVLETEPVTSLLDIYYETSTSGLINDLNTAVLNDLGISDNLSGFNTGNFNEGIAPNGNIGSNPFLIVDQFGVQLELGSAAGNYSSFTLTAAEDLQEDNISLLNYFNLVPSNPSPGLVNYNVQVTADFVNNVYFGNNEDARKFVLTFTCVLVDSPDQPIVFTEQIELANIQPDIYKNKDQPPVPADSYFPPGTVTVNKSPNDLLVLEVYGRNGANTASNPNTELDLDWDITNVTNVTSGGVLQQPYPFVLEINPVTTGSAQNLIESCKVNNNQQGTIKAGEYDISLQISDAGNITRTLIITAIFGTPPTSVFERNYFFGSFSYRFVEVYFDTPGVQNGYYIYSGSWDGNSTYVDDNPLTQNTLFTIANNITVSGYANAVTNINPPSNQFFNRWWWSGNNSNQALQNVNNFILQNWNANNGGTVTLGTGGDIAVNSNSYGFTII